jgi:TolB-like protein
MPDIFISYSSHDRLQALSLAEKLRASGYDPWIDQHQIHGANRWGKEIVQAISSSKLVAVLISSSSLLSENVVKELNLAAERHKHLLPIMLEETDLTEEFAYHLTGLHRVAIEDSDSILKSLEQLKILTTSGITPIHPTANTLTSNDIRLAVLPFDDLSREHDNEWFADGMLDELITTLGGLEHIKVPSRTDVMYYKKHHPRAQEIASDLNVRYLVGGSVRKAGEKIRITASLTDAFSNQQIWTNHYDGSFDDIFDLQERVSKEITETLKLKLTKSDVKKIEEQPTVNAEAYELYLRGLEWQRHLTKIGYDKALELYGKAIAIDPLYTQAYLSIASTCGAYYREYSREPKWLVKAEENLRKAEQITGRTAWTLWVKGEIEWQKNELESAEKTLLDAIMLDQSFHPAYNILGHIYLRMKRNKEAVWAFEKIIKDIKNDDNYFNLLIALASLGDERELKENAIKAIDVAKKRLAFFPDDSLTKMRLAYSYHWAGMNVDAEMSANELLTINDLDGYTLFNIASLYDDLGNPSRALEIIKLSIEKGFREIEMLNNFIFKNDSHQNQMEDLTWSLKVLIENEKKIV